ncbi:MAG: hypothetical protein AB7F76_18975 [Parvibaculaceae bacterium]
MALVSRSEYASAATWRVPVIAALTIGLPLALPIFIAIAFTCNMSAGVCGTILWLLGHGLIYGFPLIAIALTLWLMFPLTRDRLRDAGFPPITVYLVFLALLGVSPLTLLFGRSFGNLLFEFIKLVPLTTIAWFIFLSFYDGSSPAKEGQDRKAQGALIALTAIMAATGIFRLLTIISLTPAMARFSLRLAIHTYTPSLVIVFASFSLMIAIMALLVWRERSGGNETPAAKPLPPLPSSAAKPSGFGGRSW